MIPKPPFERDLSLESEIADLERLKGRLAELWTAVFPRDDQPYTSVVVPSVHETREPWSNYLEERLLFLLIRLRNPHARLVYITSQPLHPLVVEYYRQLLFGVPASHARSRLAFLSSGEESREVFEEAGVPCAEPGEDEASAAPSVEIRTNPRGQASLSSTHEHERPGAAHPRRACLFPAEEAYRARLQEAAARIARVLARKGVSSRLSVEFAAHGAGSTFNLSARRLQLGMGDVTHPMLALRFLTGGALDPRSGLFLSPRGQAKSYRTSDDVGSESYRGLLPEDLVEILTINHLGFNPRSETGALFHMIGAVSQFGRLGVLSIGDTRAEADRIFEDALRVLDDETRFGRH